MCDHSSAGSCREVSTFIALDGQSAMICIPTLRSANRNKSQPRDLLALSILDRIAPAPVGLTQTAQLNGLSAIGKSSGIIQMLLAVEYGGLAEQLVLPGRNSRFCIGRDDAICYCDMGGCARILLQMRCGPPRPARFAAAAFEMASSQTSRCGPMFAMCSVSCLLSAAIFASKSASFFSFSGVTAFTSGGTFPRVSVYTPFSLTFAKNANS